jgi:hypothetical protein
MDNYTFYKPHIKPKDALIQQSLENTFNSIFQNFTFGSGSSVLHKMIGLCFVKSTIPTSDK